MNRFFYTGRLLFERTGVSSLRLNLLRYAGGPSTMKIQPSTYSNHRIVNNIHFYCMIFGIPTGLLILYSNIFIGSATLADIPEGYEPSVYEYNRHPIQRFFAKWVQDPVKKYEICLAHHVRLYESRDFAKLERKVSDLMKKNDDYKAWYFVPAVSPIGDDD